MSNRSHTGGGGTDDFKDTLQHAEGLVLYYLLYDYPVTISYMFINIFTLTLGIWVILLNYLVISTLLRQRDRMEVEDIYVASLAGADFLTGVLLLYNDLYININFQSAEECRFRFGLLVLVALCSGTHLAFLAFDRFIKIAKPLHYASMFSKTKAVVICSVIWLYATIIGMIPSMGWQNDYEENNNDKFNLKCTFFGTMTDEYITFTNYLFWIPVVSMLLFYLCIFKVAYKHAKVIAMQERALQPGHQETAEKQSWKFTKMISIIVGLYVLMWTPLAIVFIVHLEGYIDNMTTLDKGTVLLYTSAPAFINSLLDPIIYAIKIKSVRKRYSEVFRCCRRKSCLPRFCRRKPTSGRVAISTVPNNSFTNVTKGSKSIREKETSMTEVA
ncbi:hypothetical protein FSP39_018226 [Pinctada imbricata]|uniref:G-protein coupled receptors family 1 profile domain-containing protein n=1 Tax=Pinctada imbricata TaxID=66713 RepID=A0AA88XX38_PINIB|nr:hypothetical protein FSP39_018226 [Pinctada imbricata]